MATYYEQTATITGRIDRFGRNCVCKIVSTGILVEHDAMEGCDHDYAMNRALLVAKTIRRARRIYFRMFGKRAP
jgi:hypothetical protein